jgi:hypothetical protein
MRKERMLERARVSSREYEYLREALGRTARMVYLLPAVDEHRTVPILR